MSFSMIVLSLDYSNRYAAVPVPLVTPDDHTGVRKWHGKIAPSASKYENG
jgi:hypothetical protein